MSINPGTRIKELRTLFGMSQEELGLRVGVQRAAINKYEKGTVTNIPLQTIERMAYVFDVSPNYIVGWDDSNSNSLSTESKVLSGVSKLYGKNALDLLETYCEVTKDGQKKIIEYSHDTWKIHSKDK
jgi:transcriptional regulator with XRE-family HTH domain